MHVLARIDPPVGDSLKYGWPGARSTPLTYGLLRQLLLDSGHIEQREAQKMDRAITRLLDS